MIKRMEVEDIVKIFTLNDTVFETVFPCTIGEWVQFLVQQAANENLLIMGIIEKEQLQGYIVVYNSVIPPISDHVGIYYAFGPGLEETPEVFDEVIKFAQKSGARKIRSYSNCPERIEKYGFKPSEMSMMELEV